MYQKKTKNSPPLTLCIFANFFIDNEERLRRMKDSFYSFRDVQPEEWRVNIRGRLKYVARDFLESELRDELSVYFLESKRGWLYDSFSFMQDVQTDFVFFWIEDHMCLTEADVLRRALDEMDSFSADQLWYSWFHDNTRRTLSHLPVAVDGDQISIFKIDEAGASQVRKSRGRDFYAVSAASIFSREFFLMVLRANRPYLKRWSKYLPFDFEKKSKDRVASEIRLAIPKEELFAAIDDDHGNPGYSLISRGMYPNRISRVEMKKIEFGLKSTRGRFMFLPRAVRSFLICVYSLSRRVCYSLSYFFNVSFR